jgi:formate C-acetyltransferase
MSIADIDTTSLLDRDASSRRITEGLYSIREKDIQSATLERLKLTWEANESVRELPQQLQLGEGLYYLLEHISVPVSPDDLILGRIIEEVPDADGEALLEKTAKEWRRGIPRWMPDGGHECFYWENLLSLGLPGLESFAQKKLSRRISAGEKGEHLNFLRGAVRIYQAFRNYARRYALSAREAGLDEQARNCSAIAERAPETFAEALQLMWLVGVVYCTMGSVNPTLTFGRLDELLLDFYRNDLAAGRMTSEEAGNLIEDFYCKNNVILGRGEHQMSGGTEKDTGWLRNLTYDAPQYIILGGRRCNGTPVVNELTQLFLERIVPAFENPVVVFRYTPDVPDDTWRLVCEKLRDNSSVLIYNDEDVIPAMIQCGIDERDAATYTMHGCNWPDIPKGRSVGGCSLQLPHHALRAIMEGEEPQNIDELYERFATSIRSEVEASFAGLRQRRETWDTIAPGHLRIDDCFLDGPVARARSWTIGGTEYSTITASIRFIASAIDCFAAVDELVFSAEKVSMSELRQALTDDFAGNEPLRQLCLNAPKFGQDNDRADKHAIRVLNTITSEFDRASRLGSSDEVIAFRCLTTDMGHIGAGAQLGATPDGRRAGKPVSDNMSPYPGSCTQGITAMLRSAAKLPLHRINSGPLNVRIQRRLVNGEEGLSRFTALLRTYFDMGGLQVQISVADTDELRDAQINPEAHRDLMVRITGYSAVFIDMCRKAQNEIIRRQELEG